MGIVEEDVAKVRHAVDFVEVASEHIALKKVGRRWVGLCPFHAEKSPSFSVNQQEGLYYCFGCQAKGDVITFVREVEHLDFVGAVERLASRVGMELRYDDVKEGKDRQRRAVLTEAMERAVEWYHQRLLTSSDAAAARGYLRSRGYDAEAVKTFRLGWAPEGWDALAKALHVADDVLQDTGLGIVNRLGRQQDAFRARIMFPIFDTGGAPVAFGGRNLPGADGPKYKNSHESPLYSKSRTLYALNWAKNEVVRSGEVIVCEGYTDVIAFFRSGMPRAVATCGTALADEHFRMLKNFARRIVLAYDADAAGQAAAERFYEWEQRYEIDLAVAALPPGSDPGDVARKDPAALRTAVEDARPFLAFRLERVLRSADLAAPEGRARAAEAGVAVIREHPNELVRDQYVMELADRCRVDPDRLRARLSRPAPTAGSRAASAEPRRSTRSSAASAEVEALLLAIHRPEEVADRLEEVLFADELHLAAYRALARSRTLHEAIDSADPGAAALLQRLAVEEPDVDADAVVARLVRRAGDRAVAALDADARAQPERALELSATVGWLKVTLEELPGADATARLVPWLVNWGREDH
ncbi:MAG TPA: DNA primase [Acidimicrobiales bacterium]|nr:DNA primase [Acidimicrobiales bacterium]